MLTQGRSFTDGSGSTFMKNTHKESAPGYKDNLFRAEAVAHISNILWYDWDTKQTSFLIQVTRIPILRAYMEKCIRIPKHLFSAVHASTDMCDIITLSTKTQ